MRKLWAPTNSLAHFGHKMSTAKKYSLVALNVLSNRFEVVAKQNELNI